MNARFEILFGASTLDDPNGALVLPADRFGLATASSLLLLSSSSSSSKPRPHVALYFTASTCKPCQAFTPTLAAWYDRVNNCSSTVDAMTPGSGGSSGDAQGGAQQQPSPRVEVVAVLSNNDPLSFGAYRKTMPWLALPLQSPHFRATRKRLTAEFGVIRLPTLVSFFSLSLRKRLSVCPFSLEPRYARSPRYCANQRRNVCWCVCLRACRCCLTPTATPSRPKAWTRCARGDGSTLRPTRAGRGPRLHLCRPPAQGLPPL
jgi:thiol-disulfide isomerase/thioredoxin